VCLSTLVGTDDADLERRFRRLEAGTTFDEWRQGRLVGTVDEVRQQLQAWEAVGTDTVILGLEGGPSPTTRPDDLAIMASACSLEAL